MNQPPQDLPRLTLLSIVIPARDEEQCVGTTVEALHHELARHQIPHEIVVIDDGSSDGTWRVLEELRGRIPGLKPYQNTGEHGFGRAIAFGIDRAKGDAVIVMMADESDDGGDAVRYWHKLNEGYHAVFGSRFIRGGQTIDYPRLKRILNRMANTFLRVLFRIELNDTTNAFKAYRMVALNGCRPFLSPHFNLTIELPLKTIIRGYSWTVIPISWRQRRLGESKLQLKEMGSRYLFIALYRWLERYFSRGDYLRRP